MSTVVSDTLDTEILDNTGRFYAEADPYLYGGATELDTPAYGLMKETMLELIRRHLHSRGMGRSDAFTFLDIGCGKGSESVPTLLEYPRSRVVAYDRNNAVHSIYQTHVQTVLGSAAAVERCQNVTGDISAANAASLLAPLKKWSNLRSYDLVVTALTLHHLLTAEKRRAYKAIASALAPGGLFINADLFTYTSSTMAEMSNEFSVEWIRKQFTNPDPQLRAIRDRLGARAEQMMNKWIEHCRDHNIPDPIESWGSGSIAGQAEMLLDAGFKEVACPFRYWGIGILWARR